MQERIDDIKKEIHDLDQREKFLETQLAEMRDEVYNIVKKMKQLTDEAVGLSCPYRLGEVISEGDITFTVSFIGGHRNDGEIVWFAKGFDKDNFRCCKNSRGVTSKDRIVTADRWVKKEREDARIS